MFQVHVTFLISSGKIYCPGHANVSFNLGAIFSVYKQKEHHFGTKYMPWNIIYFWQLLQGHVKISELSKIYFRGLNDFLGEYLALLKPLLESVNFFQIGGGLMYNNITNHYVRDSVNPLCEIT